MKKIYDKTINEIVHEQNELIAKNKALLNKKLEDLKLCDLISEATLLKIYSYAEDYTIFNTTHDEEVKLKCLKVALKNYNRENALENALDKCIEKDCQDYFNKNKKYCGFTPTDLKPYSIKYNGKKLRAKNSTDLYNKLLSVWV